MGWEIIVTVKEWAREGRRSLCSLPSPTAPISQCVLDSSLCHRNYQEGEETPSLVSPKHSPWDGPSGVYPGNEAMLGWSPWTTSHLWGGISQGQWTEQQVQSSVFTWQESDLFYFNYFFFFKQGLKKWLKKSLNSSLAFTVGLFYALCMSYTLYWS